MVEELGKALSTSIIFLTLLILFTYVGKVGAEANDQKLQNATSFILGRYNPSIGLVSEAEDQGSNVPDGTPCYRTFWIYSDNLWASQALKPFNSTIAGNISRTIAQYIEKVGNANLFEVMLGNKITSTRYDGSDVSVDYHIIDGENYTVWADRHQKGDGGIFYDAEEYADLCFYLALNCYLNDEQENATHFLKIGEGMWDGHGFLDKAANATGRYQNYKLGLYLFTVKALDYDSSIYDSVEKTTWSYQKGNGGIAAQSYPNGTIYGTANIETTSALLLAYNEEIISNFRSMRNQSATSTTTITATSTITVPTTTTLTETVTSTKTDTISTSTTITETTRVMPTEYLLEGAALVVAIVAIFMIAFYLRRRKAAELKSTIDK